jgi:hypothetical protein
MGTWGLRPTTSSTGLRHEKAPRFYRLRPSRRLRDSLCAARLARMHMAVRQLARTTESRNGGVLHARPPDGDRWPHYVSISGHRCVLRPWRVVRDLPMASRALGSRALRGPSLRGAVLPAESRHVNRAPVQESKTEENDASDEENARADLMKHLISAGASALMPEDAR